MSLFVLSVYSLLFATGFYIEYSQSWNGLYKANILFHPGIGIAGGLWLAAVFVLHARARMGGGGAEDSAKKMAGRAFLATAAAAVMAAFFPMLFMAVAFLAAAAFYLTARKLLAADIDPATKAVAVAWQATYFLTLLSLVSGAALLPTDGFARNRVFFPYHMRVSVMAAMSFFVALLLPVILRRRDGAGWLPRLKAAAPALGTAAAFAVALAAIFAVERAAPRPALTEALTAATQEQRLPNERMEEFLPEDVSKLLMISNSCGAVKGCHAYQLEDLYMSNHWRNSMFPHYLKNVEKLAEETEPLNRAACDSCHIPYTRLAGNFDPKDEYNRMGLSCVMCHQMTGYRMREDGKVSFMTLEANVNHLKMFDRPESAPKISRWNEALIKMNPAAHGRTLNGPFMREDGSCLVCHYRSIREPKHTGFKPNSCIRCHMLARNDLGHEGYDFSHFMPGANPVVPYVTGKPELADLIGRWVRGDMDSLIGGTGKNGTAKLALNMNVEPIAAPRAAGVFEFDLVTTNLGMEHRFPSATPDLIEAWIEMSIIDGEGRSLYDIGKLDEAYELPESYPKEHKLVFREPHGGFDIDYYGSVTHTYNIYAKLRPLVERAVEPGQTIRDRFKIFIPAEAKGPLLVKAKWNYRKVNQEFFEFGLDGEKWDESLPRTAPTLTVGRFEASVRLASAERKAGGGSGN